MEALLLPDRQLQIVQSPGDAAFCVVPGRGPRSVDSGGAVALAQVMVGQRVADGPICIANTLGPG
jgi:hypothetical protein